MPNDIRLKKLERVALERAAQVVAYELSDPRLTMVTLTRVDLAGDLSYATIFWSVLGEAGARSKAEHALRDATPVVQQEVARVFHTRRSPRITFKFDPSIEGAVRMGGILDKLSKERGPADEPAADPDGTAHPSPSTQPSPSTAQSSSTPDGDAPAADDAPNT